MGCDVTAEFKKAVLEVEESEWAPVRKIYNDIPTETNQQWTEVCFIPAAIAYSKNAPVYCYLAIRKKLNFSYLPGMESLQKEIRIRRSISERNNLTGGRSASE